MNIAKYGIPLLSILFVNTGLAVTNYDLVRIDLGGDSSFATDINDSGVVVGKGNLPSGHTHAFIYSDGNIVDLGTLCGIESEATSINSINQVVGSARNATGESHAFLYSEGIMLDLGTLGGISSLAEGINDISQITGVSRINSGSVERTFLFQVNTGMINLEISDPMFLSDSWGKDINASGDIVGNLIRLGNRDSGYLYTNGSTIFFDNLVSVCCINDNGIFVGKNSVGTSFVSDGLNFRRIEPLPFSSSFSANDINNGGYIVGELFSSGTGLAYIVTPDGVPFDLNSLVSDKKQFDELTAATGINEHGWISGYGRIGFNYYAFLLIPHEEIPAPDTTPDAFLFIDVENVALATDQVSNEIIVSGINAESAISIIGGKYSIDGNIYSENPATVANGSRILVRHVSSELPNSPTDTTLTIGGVSDTFTSITAANPSGDIGDVNDRESNEPGNVSGSLTIVDLFFGALILLVTNRRRQKV